MAMKIKGITIELSADTSGLEKALKGINKSLSTTQKDLKDVNKALKLDPKNLELIEQKERLLTKAVEETTQKVEALKKAQASIKMDGSEEAQRQYDALAREISASEVNLRNLNMEQQNFSREAQSARTGATAFGQALDTVKTKADEVAKATAAISAAAATALAGLAGVAISGAQWADNLAQTAQQTGLSTDALQKMQYAAELVDVPLETIVGAVRKMKGHLDDNEATWDRLGVKVKDQSGDYRDIESIFFDVVRALGQIENETERDKLAMDLFGRSADELAGIIDDGGKKLRELGREAEDLGIVVPEEDIEKLNQLSDALERMKAQLKGAAAQAAVPIFEALQPVVEKVADAIKRFSQFLSNLNPKLIAAVVVILTIVAAISPIASIISGIASGIGTLINLIPTLVAGIQMISMALTSLMANPYALAIAAIIVAVVALAAAVKYCADNWDTIGPAVNDAINTMQNGISNVTSKVGKLASDVKGKLTGAFGGVEGVFTALARAAAAGLGGIPAVVINVALSFRQITKEAEAVANNVVKAFSDLINKARNAGANVVNAFTQGVRSVINSVIRTFQQLADSIKSIWSTTERDARYAGRNTAANYMNGYDEGSRYRRTPFSISSLTSPVTPRSTNSASVGNGQLLNAINSLNASLQQVNKSQPTNVNVTLSGSAKNIFDTVTVQNSQLVKATGYHALA